MNNWIWAILFGSSLILLIVDVSFTIVLRRIIRKQKMVQRSLHEQLILERRHRALDELTAQAQTLYMGYSEETEDV